MAIVEAAQEQSSGLQQINTAVNQMDQDTQKNAAMVEETTAASHGLAREASSLNQLLGQFKLSATFEAPIRAATPAERPSASPARALGRKLATAFSAMQPSSRTGKSSENTQTTSSNDEAGVENARLFCFASML